MAENLEPLDISHVPELLRLVEEVQAADRPRVLQIDHKDVALLVPARRATRARARGTTATDPLWQIVGLAESDGPGDVAENVDTYVTEAYGPPE